jgi:hypothetical protein
VISAFQWSVINGLTFPTSGFQHFSGQAFRLGWRLIVASPSIDEAQSNVFKLPLGRLHDRTECGIRASQPDPGAVKGFCSLSTCNDGLTTPNIVRYLSSPRSSVPGTRVWFDATKSVASPHPAVRRGRQNRWLDSNRFYASAPGTGGLSLDYNRPHYIALR